MRSSQVAYSRRRSDCPARKLSQERAWCRGVPPGRFPATQSDGGQHVETVAFVFSCRRKNAIGQASPASRMRAEPKTRSQDSFHDDHPREPKNEALLVARMISTALRNLTSAREMNYEQRVRLKARDEVRGGRIICLPEG